jgi:hypothetical protein
MLDRLCKFPHNGGMIKRLADVIYWGCSIIAALSGAFSLYIITAKPNSSYIEGFAQFSSWAVLIWIAGWATRYVLTGNKGIKP